jgi:hypothetical protein
VWTDPSHLAQWWGPHGFTNPVCEMDVRPGGALRIVMRAPDGTDYPMKRSSAKSSRPSVSSSPISRWDPLDHRLFRRQLQGWRLREGEMR